jgi:hypothetical protein
MTERSGALFSLSSLIWAGTVVALVAAGCDSGGDISGSSPGTSLPRCAASCTGGVHFAADLLVGAAQATALSLRLCRKDLCSTRSPAASGAAFDCGFAGPLTAACTLTQNGSGLHLEILFQGVMTAWAPGDDYTIQVGLPGAALLVDKHQVVQYQMSPAGPDCPPLCLSADLS